MNSFIAWVGGKKLLRKIISDKFPEKFDKYVEVFGGAGWVLFYKDKYAKTEVYNDINRDLVNLFKCVKYHPEAIEKELELSLNSRQIFNEYKNQMDCIGLTDIQRAVRYLYLIKSSYGARINTYGSKPRDISNTEFLKDVMKRLSKVVIENKSFEKIISAYDNEGTLFYLDPPYHNTENMYDTGDFIFDEEQHIKLRDILKDIKGKFVLSYNDDEFIRELYKDFKIEGIERQNNLSLNSGSRFKEVVITNY